MGKKVVTRTYRASIPNHSQVEDELAETFGWSAPKTFPGVSDLVDDGRVEKTLLGCENVLKVFDDE